MTHEPAMLYHSLALKRLNATLSSYRIENQEYQDILDSISGIEDVQILGGLVTIVYGRYGERRILNTTFNSNPMNTADAEMIDKYIIVSLAVTIHQGNPTVLLEQSVFPAQAIPETVISAINAQFTLPGSFHADGGWVVGDSYIIHGFHGDIPAIVTPFIERGRSLQEAVVLGVEAGNWQRLLTAPQKHQVYIAIDDHHFYVSTVDELAVKETNDAQ